MSYTPPEPPPAPPPGTWGPPPVAPPAPPAPPTAGPSPEVRAFVERLRGRRPIATYTLAGAILAVFGLETLWGGNAYSPTLARMGADVPALVRAGEWWRLLASTFLHAGPMHVLFNVWVLVALGTFLERLLGTRRYLVLYTLSGLGGSALSIAFSQATLSVGASGCLWGFLAASGALVLRPAGLIPNELMPNLRKNALINLGLNVMNSFRPGVDWLAHAGGGIVGGLLVFAGVLTAGTVARPGEAPRRDGPVWTALAVISVLALAGSLGTAFAQGKPWLVTATSSWAQRPLGNTGVSVDVPGSIADRARTAPTGTTTEYMFGHMPLDPAFVGVVPVARDAPVDDPAALREEYQSSRAELMTFEPGGGAQPDGEPVDTDVGGYPALVRRWRFPTGLYYERLTQLRPTHVVIVEYVYHPDGPAWLRDGGRHVLESVRVQAP